MNKFIEKVKDNSKALLIRELKKEQGWIDYVDSPTKTLEPVKPTPYQKWVHWWNGKKTIIGFGAILASIVLAVVNIPGATLTGVTGALTAAYGLAHKLFKANKFGGKGNISLDKNDLISLIIDTWNIIKRWGSVIKSFKSK